MGHVPGLGRPPLRPLAPDPAQLAHLVHPPLRLDTDPDGGAWLGIVAFRISRIQLLGSGSLIPAVSCFPEVNLRTYVRLHDRPCVLFLSLHCPNHLAMALARPWFRLPYRHADVCLQTGPEGTAFASRSPDHADFAATYAATSPADDALGRWLTERYCYYTQRADRTYRCDIAHAPWPRATPARPSPTTLAAPFNLPCPQGLPSSTPRSTSTRCASPSAPRCLARLAGEFVSGPRRRRASVARRRRTRQNSAR